MPEMITIPEDKLENLKKRTRKLAKEKSFLQLSMNMMNKLSAMPGLNDTVDTLLHVVLDSIGGANVVMYYRRDHEIHSVDVLGKTAKIDTIDDSLAARAFETGEFLEIELAFKDTLMQTREFSKATSCAVPLIVGTVIVGVLKMEGLHLSVRDVREQFQPFFNYAALVLKNEISNYEQIQKAYDGLMAANDKLTAEIEQRMKAEEALNREREFSRALLESTIDGVVACDAEGRLTLFNRTAREWHGTDLLRLPPEEWAKHYDLFRADGITPLPTEEIPLARAYRGDTVTDAGMAIVAKGQSARFILANGSLIRDEAGRKLGAVVIMRDVTTLKRVEDELRRSNEELEKRVAERTVELKKTNEVLRATLEAAPIPIFDLDLDGRVKSLWNAAAERLLGWRRGEVVGNFLPSVPEEGKREFAVFREQMSAGKSILGHDVVRRRKDGSPVEYSIYAAPVFGADGEVIGNIAALVDVTERKKVEESLRRLNRQLRAISDCNQTLMRAIDEQTLLNQICRIICDQAGYRMAWVGYAEKDEGRSIRPVAFAGVDEGYISEARLSWGETERGRGPAGMAIRSSETIAIQDFTSSPQFAPWLESALKRGFRSGIWLPLKDDRMEVFGVLLIYSAEINAFSLEEINLLEELAGDLAFGITVLRARIERKQVEQRLTLLDFALNNVHDEAFLITEQAGFAYVNDQSCRALGYSRDQLLGMNVSDVDPDFPGERWQEHWHDLRERNSITFEGRHRTSSGRFYPVEISANYFEYDGVGYNLALGRDITERKRAEEALQVERKLFIGGPNVAFKWKADEGWPVEYVSPNIVEQFGYTPEDFTSGEVLFASIIHPDDLTRVAEEVDTYSKGKVLCFDQEYRIARADGAYRWVYDFTVVIRDAEGVVTHYQGHIIDITERKQAEEMLREREAFIRNILDSVDEGFIVVDREYRIVAANRAFCEMMKLPENLVVGRLCYEITHRLDQPCFQAGEACAVKHTFESHFPHSVMHTHTDPNGLPQYVEIKAFPIFDASGAIVSAIETVNDVTERRRLEDQLRQSQKMEAIGTLAGGIAHDFNNILTAIIGYGDLVKVKMSPDDPHRPAIDQILTSADRAAQLTRGLLAFSRKQVINPRPVDLNDIVRNIEKFLHRIIGEDISLSTQLFEKNLIAMVDSIQIEQVLLNFATNARDAMPGGGTLTISTREVELGEDFVAMHGFGQPGKYALIAVSDTGQGMDEQTREKIFEPFFTTKEMGKGTGLGLAIVYGIIKQHNGNINVYSEPGKGSTFKIYLPLIVTSVVEAKEEMAAPPSRGRETILLAEDDPGVRDLTAMLLKDYGYQVIEAVDGQDAVDKFAAHSEEIDLLLLDVIMPRKSGKEVYDVIKAELPAINTLFISGYTADFIHKKGIFEAGLDFISKPVSPFELLRKIREILDRK